MATLLLLSKKLAVPKHDHYYPCYSEQNRQKERTALLQKPIKVENTNVK